ncbi:MAG: hypothetical protein EP329_13130 [Deltaproteobacteria bacterium]|nr:MAG: hypothetical protein EP329_13130 [Deltaproteobacteria bacterium]
MSPIARWALPLSLTICVACGGDAATKDDTFDGDDATLDVVDDTAEADDVADTAAAPDEPPGTGFHTAGRWIVDGAGRTVMLHGANVDQATKYSADRLPWHGPEDFASLAATGLNSVRLLLHWAAIMPTEGEIDDAWLDALGERLDWCHAAGLLVVLDMHQDIFGEGFGDNGAPLWACDQALYDAYAPQSTWYLNYLSPQVQACFDHFYGDDALFSRFVEAWVAVVERFGDHPAVVGFDLLNEPHQGTYDMIDFVPDVWQPRQEQLAAALRALAPDRVIFFGAPPYQSLGVVATFTPTPTPNVAFAPHYYHPGVHDGGDYLDSYADDLDNAFGAIAASAEALGGEAPGVPAWVGEMGGPTLTVATLPAYIDAMMTRFTARGWGFAWYSDDRADHDAFGLRDADGAFLPDILGPVAHPYPRRLPGPLVTARLDPPARRYEATFTWSYDAPLELWVGPSAPLTVAVAPADAPDAPIACAQAADAPTGVWTCPADGVAWQRDYAITLEWPAP